MPNYHDTNHQYFFNASYSHFSLFCEILLLGERDIQCNIMSNMFYFSFGADILRIARVSSSTENFVTAARALVIRITRQGGIVDRMKRVLGKIYANHTESFVHIFNEVTALFNILT